MAITLRIPQVLRTHKKKMIAALVVLVLLVLGYRQLTKPKQAQYITAVAARGDLQQTVEAVGTVTSEHDLDLRFAATGIVSQVYVKEGDHVTAGQKLAQLKAGSLAADIASQQAALESANADLQALQEGSRPEDIAITQADLDNKTASLQAAKQSLIAAEGNLATSQQNLTSLQQEATVNLAGQVSTALSTINEQLTSAENALSTIDDVLNRTDVQDALIKYNPAASNEIRQEQQSAKTAIAGARTAAASAGTDYKAAEQAMSTARDSVSAAGTALDSLFTLLGELPETAYFTSSVRETVKSSVAAQRSTVQDAAGNIGAALSTLQNASATYDTKISSEQGSVVAEQGLRDKAQADILTYQSAVRSAQASLDLKKAGARQTDLDAAQARVRQQQALLARSASAYSDTILTSPVTGTVTHVNIRIGESLPTGAAVTVLGQSPYRIEMFVSEIDIAKVQVAQTGSIDLDAFRGKPFALRVGDVDAAATDKDGVPKYRVRLDFVYPHDELKIGMTGDAAIITGMRSNVIHIPLRSVLEDANGHSIVRILKKDNTIEERPVTTGMEGQSGDVEITGGVQEGETVVVLVKQ